MDGELDRLRRLYAELDDEHLLDLSEDLEGLTPDAQIALGEELRRRTLQHRSVRDDSMVRVNGADATPAAESSTERADGFGVGVPGFFPGAAPAVEQALEPGGETRLGMVGLASFFDGLELRRACEALEDADIEPAIEEIAGDPTVGSPSRFEIWVNAADAERSKVVLRRKLGMFPLSEANEIDESDAIDEVMDGSVGNFETTAEAEEVRGLLAGAGFSASIEIDPEAADEGKTWSSVKVRPEEREHAMEFLAERLGLEKA